MDFIGSAFIGIATGFIAGRIMKSDDFGAILNLIIGVVGGLFGGWIFALFVPGFDSLSGHLAASTIGAVALLWFISLFRNKSYLE